MTRPLAAPLLWLLRALGRAYPACYRGVGRVEAWLVQTGRRDG